jgi:hypothetical protein
MMNKFIANVSLVILLTLPSLEAGKVVSGYLNQATGKRAAVVAGKSNAASAGNSLVGAGQDNTATGYNATVLGGAQNTAVTQGASVLTGYQNANSGRDSAILSGTKNQIQLGAVRSSVLAGSSNTIESSAWSSFIGAGYNNSNAGDKSAILMGSNNMIGAGGDNTLVAGVSASSDHKNSFVFNTDNFNPLATTKDGQFLVNAMGGVVLKGGVTIQGNLLVTGGLDSEGGVVMVGEKGDPGPQGLRGDSGQNGLDGLDGADGVSISVANINANGDLILTLTNGSIINAGSVGGGGALPLALGVGSTIAWQNPYYNETISGEVVSYDAQADSGIADADIKDDDPDDADRSLSYIFEYSFEDDFDVIEYREIGVVSTDQEALDHLNNIISDPTNPITVAINAYITEPSPENDQLLDDAIFAANLNYALEVTDNDEIFIHIGGEVRVEAFSTTGTQRIYGPQIRLNSGNTAFEFVGGGYVGVTTTISNFVVVEVPQ